MSKANRRVLKKKSPGIPPFISDKVYTMKIRSYLSSEATSPSTISFELPTYPWAYSISSSVLVLPFKCARLKKIEIWSNFNPDYSIDHNTINLSYTHTSGVRMVELSDTATYSRAAHLVQTFGEDERVGWFYTQANGQQNPEIQLLVNHRSVIEFTIEYIMSDGSDGSGKTYNTSGLTSQMVYTNAIGGLLPVGRKAAVSIPY